MVIGTFFMALTLISYLRVLLSYPGQAIHATPLSLSAPTAFPRFYYSPRLLDPKTMHRRRDIEEPTETTSLLPVVSISKNDGLPRYCETCQCYKPDRTHHCKECNTCILKMDHHCPWISGCVGHKNYKFFFLFVLYCAVYAVWVLATSIPTVVEALTKQDSPLDPQWIVLLVLAFVFGMTLVGFAAVHGYYIIENKTTIEHISQRPNEVRIDFDTSGYNYEIVTTHADDNLWNLGHSRNWRSVMGKSPWSWFLPIYGGLGDGSIFPYNDALYERVIERAKRQRVMLNPPIPQPV
ncbi:DHHC palmitoyltransferase-domain-containing protein [Fennellomyces sp. T-0311]|nr:DHHC palmitoyltransferase-domain-containing protein [Fennellomyces sp. T-0311]